MFRSVLRLNSQARRDLEPMLAWGRRRSMHQRLIERLWRSLMYECIYLSELTSGSEARRGIGWWIDSYNDRRPHSALDDRTLEDAYSDERTARRSGLRPASPQPEEQAA